MAEESVFRSVLSFFTDIGIYDVILPFLLVFTIVFAILEKTKVLGTEEIEGKKYTKKNLNSMVAFVMAFLVVASAQLVRIINETMANIVLLLLISVSFLLLIGSFYREDEHVALFGGWRTAFTWGMLVALLLIFAAAIRIDTSSGEQRLLVWLWSSVVNFWDTRWMAAIILLIIVVIFMYFIVNEGRPTKSAHEKKGGD
ncbi:MAG: hypothetical protein QS98_C0001G0005 [archaeon GW2011_AR3]|nr:MAG: hypothetical protein QS98_C0001G0005 [archaeon GW2011_AR3]MBS3109283.1 hypothetical protein [Candidatus Woesearchaeota archaeon]